MTNDCAGSDPKPYRSTPIFDEATLPAALRREHRTKAGVWGLIRLLQGELRLTVLDPPGERILTPESPGVVLPGQTHFVEPLGSIRMQVDFYDQPPPSLATGGDQPGAGKDGGRDRD